MNSIRALDLRLTITAHSQIEWFNLPWTMPNLQTIYIQSSAVLRSKVAAAADCLNGNDGKKNE
ncbi:hypothetical protein TYRP_012869 [Tyrophagus putrescentiae]|nr:hypothetical protein TYRP_012869 [Tyrophagus putrescentiae]